MLRKFLTVVLPLILPFLLYGLYVALARWRARTAGTGPPPKWQEAPWTLIICSAVVLLAAALIAVRLSTGVDPGTKLVPPRYIDGVIEPSHPAE